MSLVLPTDLVADVLKAAEPRRETLARSRLEGAAGTAFASETDAVAALGDGTGIPGTAGATLEESGGTGSQLAGLANTTREGLAVFQGTSGTPAPSAAPQTSLNGQLEAFFLSRAVESMMPADQKAFFGEGPGADTWRSMLADQFGSALQSGGSLGILPTTTGITETAKTAKIGQDSDEKQRPA